MERKSILFIVPRFGTVHRGVEVFVEEMCRRLDGRRFTVSILSAHHNFEMSGVEFLMRHTLPRERLYKLYRSVIGRLFFRTQWLRGPTEVEALILMLHSIRVLRSRHFDIVVPQGGSWTYLFADLLTPTRTRIISIGHAGPVKSDLKRSDFFVALTPRGERGALQLCPKIGTAVIPNGVDCEVFKPKARSRESTTRTILTVGALAYDKRHDLLFDAVLLLDGDVNVVVVGDGPERGRLMQHPLYQAGRVEFRQYTHEEMPACYNDADIFTLASPDEAFGIVFLEAMASGLNVVAHDGDSQRFVLGDAALFCNVYEPHDYASSLEKALRSERTQATIQRARMFDWREMAKKYESLFASL